MMRKFHARWAVTGFLALAMGANLLGVMTASAQTVSATSGAQLSVMGDSTVAPGTGVAFKATGFSDSESISMWINVPDGTVVASDALGQTNTAIVGTVIPLDNPPSADAYGQLAYTLNTSGLPSGDYSLVAHGDSSGLDMVAAFTVSASAPAPAPAASATTLAPGAAFSIQGSGYTAGENIGMWINIPSNVATISSTALGQTDTVIDGTVIPVDAMASADAYGNFTYTLNTAGLPNGDYSLVAHGLGSALEKVFMFSINGTAAAATTNLSASSSTTVAAGSLITFVGKAYQADEPVSFWVNTPNVTAISTAALGQSDTTLVGTVIPVDAIASADDYGNFTYTLNTTGLPSGTYSLVAHGLNSAIEGVVIFTVQ